MSNYKVFITGGAGFIGCNLADFHLNKGHEVIIFDNLSRRGTEANLAWLRARFGARLSFTFGDIRDFDSLCESLPGDVDRIYHMAGQVAVTTSVRNPREDFDINALGTLNVLEAVRNRAPHTILFYASTNKVYGGLESVPISENRSRYRFADLPYGIPEEFPLDFHSPYGCSKGSGDQYVRDYSRIYGLRTVVLRQSCIYGTRQFGIEDQGWIAHFCIAACQGRAVTIYGNGKQVRDALWIDDLIAAYEAAAEHIELSSGQIYNIGGGPDNTISIWMEFRPLLEKISGHPVPFNAADWRPGDQLAYISDIRKAERDLGWRPKVSVNEGVERLWRWISTNLEVLRYR
jgi:CDP-paratose 2-epimerase